LGRTKTRNVPLQETGSVTTFNYNIDNSVQSVTDARGATANYSYFSNTGLLQEISYTSPNPTVIPVTPTTTFTYDNLGNRKSMVDGAGNVQYDYNSLSQMTAETRYFTENLPFAPLVNGVRGFKLEYNYAMNGQLSSIKDPFGQQINYGFDKVGRLDNVTGSSFGGVTNYANNPQYRAFGALKHLEYGNNNAQMNQDFNNRLQAANYQVTKTYSNGNTVNVVKSQYQYNGDGSLKSSTNDVNTAYNRYYAYDSIGRLKTDMASGVPIGQVNFGQTYREEFFYDAFGRMVHRKGKSWEGTTSEIYLHYNHDVNADTQKYPYQNGREQNPDYVYDLEGNLTGTSLAGYGNTNVFDTSGQMIKSAAPANGTSEIEWKRDGQGQEVRHGTRKFLSQHNQWESWKYNYFIISSVLKGQIITEVKQTGAKQASYVYVGGELLARQTMVGNPTPFEKVSWRHADASGKTERWATLDAAASLNGRSPDYAELNADGMSLPVSNFDDGSLNLPEFVSRISHPNGEMSMGGGGCQIDGEPASCAMAESIFELNESRNPGPKPRTLQVHYGQDTKIMRSPTVFHSPSESNNLAFKPPSSRANPSSLFATTTANTRTTGGIRETVTVPIPSVSFEIPAIGDASVGGDDSNLPNGFIMTTNQQVMDKIYNIIDFTRNNPACTEAFRAAGAVPIEEQIGVRIIGQDIIDKPELDKSWSPEGSTIADEIRATQKKHPLTNDISTSPVHDDGNRYIFVTKVGMSEEVDYLDVTIIHSFLHTGGISSQTWTDWLFWRKTNKTWEEGLGFGDRRTHDLRFLDQAYDSIIANCTKSGKSKQGLAAR
jgi:hypothetical protein